MTPKEVGGIEALSAIRCFLSEGGWFSTDLHSQAHQSLPMLEWELLRAIVLTIGKSKSLGVFLPRPL